MKFIIIIIVSAFLGALVGLIFDLKVYEIITIGIISGFVSFIIASPEGKLSPYEKRYLEKTLDEMTIVMWFASPALKSEKPSDYRGEGKVNDILTEFMSREAFKLLSDRNHIDHIVALSDKNLSPPYAALKRHNRKNKPSFFKKASSTYGILETVAPILVEAGVDEVSARWYFHCTNLLGVKNKDAYIYLENAYFHATRTLDVSDEATALSSPLFRAGADIIPKRKDAQYIEAVGEMRQNVLDLM